MCDVTNPLCGKDGATYTFGGQKGATPEIQKELEVGMCNYRDIIKQQFNLDMDTIPGAGAAGGLGTALMVFLNGTLKSGIETVLDLVDFDEHLKDVDIVVTGEGATDWQSVFGKVMQGVGVHCKAHHIPAVAIVGSMGKCGRYLCIWNRIYHHYCKWYYAPFGCIGTCRRFVSRGCQKAV